jgi:hypothetical protein
LVVNDVDALFVNVKNLIAISKPDDCREEDASKWEEYAS